jgi:hypothetical protein
VYVRDCLGKTRVYVLKHFQVKDKVDKLRLKINRGFQAIIRQETQYKRELIKGKKHSKSQKEDSLPSMVANYVTRKITLWHGVNHNKRK